MTWRDAVKTRRILAGLAMLAAGVLACSDSSAPGGNGNIRPPSELNVLRLALTAPPLFTDTVSFWARYDEDTEAKILFADSLDPQQPGDEFLTFKVDKYALFQRPDGSQFGPGDSVLITIRVVNAAELLFEFQPAGLKFNSLKPAALELEYGRCGEAIEGDYNGDGQVNGEDDDIEQLLALWRQATLSDPYVRLSTLVEVEFDEIEAEIREFSRYALAY